MNLSIQKKINNIQKKEKVMNICNVVLIAVLLTLVIVIIIHKVYLKENTYSLLSNTIVNSEETVVIESKDTEINNGELENYIVFSNDRIRNKIYVNKGVYDECKLGDETVVYIKDIYDKKGNILKEELLFDIID